MYCKGIAACLKTRFIPSLAFQSNLLPNDSQMTLSFPPGADVGELFTWITTRVLEHSRTLNILAFKEPISYYRSSKIPSWIPDFYADEGPFALAYISHFDAASVRSSIRASTLIEGGELRVWGANISLVTAIESMTVKKCEFLQSCLRMATEMDPINHATGQDRLSAIW